MTTKRRGKTPGRAVGVSPGFVREFFQNCENILNSAFSTQQFSRFGYMTGGRPNAKGRDLEKECGYPTGEITFDQYEYMYRRSDIAKRVVDIFPDETWAVNPRLVQSQDPKKKTRLESMWEGYEDDPEVQPWHYLHRLDVLSGIGTHAVMFIGFDDEEDLSKPVAGLDDEGRPVEGRGRANKVLYHRLFTPNLAAVREKVKNPKSPRNGFPRVYDLILSDPIDSEMGAAADDQDAVPVHWTRVLHAADNRMTSELVGVPRMEPNYNRLLDLRKILGSSGEMFYKGGWPGYSIEQMPGVPEDLELDEDSIRDQMDKFYNNLKRYVAFIGAQVKTLAPNIADPASHVEQQLRIIAASMGIPLRIFLGSEAAHLASTQDIQTWNKRVAKRQKNYVEPMLIRPYISRLMAAGALPRVAKYGIEWKDMNALSDKDKADVSLKKAQAILQYVSSGSEKVMPLVHFLTNILEMPTPLANVIVSEAIANKDLLTKELWKQAGVQPAGSGKKSSSKKTGSGSTRNAIGNAA